MKRLFSSETPWTQRADLFLYALALLGITFHLLSEQTRRLHPQPDLREKMAAATQTVRCFEAIRGVRMGTPAAMDPENDPQASGLIGQEFTLTTTDRGILEAKLTAVNPNFAALFVQYYLELKLQPGDPVAIASTGSFPSLNIAALVAAEELDLEPILITSVGASMWGANDPNFTWLDMETLLNDRVLIRTKSLASSFGGSNDRGRGLSPKGRDLLLAAIERNKIALISEPTLEEAIQRRIELYDEAAGDRGVRAYVNIGGGSASIGSSLNGTLIPPGVNKTLKPYNWTRRGVLHHYASRRVPIIHILRVQSIALDHDFPIAPETIPSVGEGAIYHREVYDLRVVVPEFVIFLFLCFGVLRARHHAARSAREAATFAASSPADPG